MYLLITSIGDYFIPAVAFSVYVCMYVCMYIYIYIYIRFYTHVHVHVFIHVFLVCGGGRRCVCEGGGAT